MLNILLLAAGFGLLIFGAEKLVDGASALAKRYDISNIVIGLTIVAFGTSAPEIVVNLIAAFNGSTALVLGNVLGSNIFNVLVILGISSVIYPLTVKSNTTWIEIPLSFLAALVVGVVAADIYLDNLSESVIRRTDGVIFLLFFIIFLVYNLQIARSGGAEEEVEIKEMSVGKSILLMLAGIAGLVIGGRLIVTGGVNIAALLGISERIIGLTIVSIGTSLPELATSVVAVRKKNVDVAIGNVVGSNIFNIFLVLGLSAVVTPIGVDRSAYLDIAVNIVAGLLLFAFLFTGKGRRLERWEGLLFLGIYIAYIYALIMGWQLL